MGLKQKTWYLPKEVLTHCSPFFDAALNGNFSETSSKAVSLPEDDPFAFEMWAAWLSTGRLEEYCDDICYVRAWKLGDKLVCPAFKDHVMSQFVEWYKSGDLCLDTIQLIYDVSPPGSKLRRLFVDLFIWDKRNGILKEDAEDYVKFLRGLPEFSDDVVRREVTAGSKITQQPWDEKHHYYEKSAFDPDAWMWR